MKKWFIGISLMGLAVILLVYYFSRLVYSHSAPYREVSFDVPAVEALPLHAQVKGVNLDTFGREKVILVSFFASWCGPCHLNHGMLNILAQKHRVEIVGINVKDQPMAAQFWLMENGNPFSSIGSDPQGKVAAGWGVRGIPQMFLVDKNKKVRFSYTGALSEKQMEEFLLPMIRSLESEK